MLNLFYFTIRSYKTNNNKKFIMWTYMYTYRTWYRDKKKIIFIEMYAIICSNKNKNATNSTLQSSNIWIFMDKLENIVYGMEQFIHDTKSNSYCIQSSKCQNSPKCQATGVIEPENVTQIIDSRKNISLCLFLFSLSCAWCDALRYDTIYRISRAYTVYSDVLNRIYSNIYRNDRMNAWHQQHVVRDV